MAALFGTVSEFEEGKEEWMQYVERLEHFFAANGIEDADKKHSAHPLTSCYTTLASIFVIGIIKFTAKNCFYLSQTVMCTHVCNCEYSALSKIFGSQIVYNSLRQGSVGNINSAIEVA